MDSAIYTGWVRHRRFTPRQHKFIYPVFMMYLDLDELTAVFEKSRWWSEKPWRPARFQRSDFLGDKSIPLDHAVRNRILEETGQPHIGPIRMLANLRYFGFNMNPIACYYCFDNNQNLKTIVTEVTNTPWKERHSYVLSCQPGKRFHREIFDKKVHVSPFNPMRMTYHWCSNQPAERLSLNLETKQDGAEQVDATLLLTRQEINSRRLTSILLQYPWMTAKVAFAIYWQALRLWIKGVPFYNHPKSGIQNNNNTTTN